MWSRWKSARTVANDGSRHEGLCPQPTGLVRPGEGNRMDKDDGLAGFPRPGGTDPGYARDWLKDRLFPEASGRQGAQVQTAEGAVVRQRRPGETGRVSARITDGIQGRSPMHSSPCGRLGWEVESLDIRGAYLHADLGRTVYMAIPPELAEDEQVAKYLADSGLDPRKAVLHLRKAIYGLSDRGRQWYFKFISVLESVGFTRLKSEQATLVLRD